MKNHKIIHKIGRRTQIAAKAVRRISALMLALILASSPIITSHASEIPDDDPYYKGSETSTGSSDADTGKSGYLFCTRTYRDIKGSLVTYSHDIRSADDYIIVDVFIPYPDSSSSTGFNSVYVIFKNPSLTGFTFVDLSNKDRIFRFYELANMKHIVGSDVYYCFKLLTINNVPEFVGSNFVSASVFSDLNGTLEYDKYHPDTAACDNAVWDLYINGKLAETPSDPESVESSAVYNKSLDFASISADFYAKYCIRKDENGNWDFITPDEAGIHFDWTNRVDIDGAYVKFTFYGEYNDSFWATSHTDTYVTLTCPRKNDLSFLGKQKDLIALAKEKCNGSKGYGFVVNYIYVQAFANINGTFSRSRIYKFNSDLVSDYGNADFEDDEWLPAITDGVAMPDDYTPNLDNLDPEKTEPKFDADDDTVINTSVNNNPDIVINDDTSYLEAFKQFINVMKQGISYLGDFPALISAVFSYLPSIFLIFIGSGFAVALILRFLGR